MTPEDLEAQADGVEDEINALRAKQMGLRRQALEMRNRKFWASRSLDDIERPFLRMGHVGVFGKWLRANPSHRRFAAWCGTIYLRSDLERGSLGKKYGTLPDGVRFDREEPSS